MSEFRRGENDDGWRDGDSPRTSHTTRATHVPTSPPVPPPPRTTPTSEKMASQPAATTTKPRPTVLRHLLRLMAYGTLVIATTALALIVMYRFTNPPASALMLQQRLAGTRITQTWVPLHRISPHLVRAVIMSEDAGFCRHYGVDISELRAAIERTQDGIPRGGSTITMQTAKNLFLWPSKSYVRKAIEIPLTLMMEAVWPKARTLEIYLNIVEWGPGIFGAEAAARHHFNTSADRLTERDAALLAVSLPAPLIRKPGRPSALLGTMGATIEGRMRTTTRHAACILPATTGRQS
jgi:monofunctional glycosyltransferase